MPEIAQIPLTRLIAIQGARLVQQSDAAILITKAGQWHYSAEADFELPNVASRSCSVNLSVEVETGRIGVGWLNADGSAWVARALVDRTAASLRVRLDVPAATYKGRLVIENASEDGRPAIAVLHRIWISEIDPVTQLG